MSAYAISPSRIIAPVSLRIVIHGSDSVAVFVEDAESIARELLHTAAEQNPVTALRGLDQRPRGTGSVLTVNVKPSSNGFGDVESVGVWRYPEMRAISRLHVRTIATRLRLLRRTAPQEKMTAGGTAWYQHGADTRFLSCPDADTRYRPHLIIHDAPQWWPVPATLSAAERTLSVP